MSVTDINIFDYIKTNGVDGLKGTDLITGITDLANGRYRVLTDSTKAFNIVNTYQLTDKSNITISGTNSLNGVYRITNVDADVSFDLLQVFGTEFVNIDAGLSVDFEATASWTNYNPTFYHDSPDFLNLYLEAHIRERIPFPAIILLEEITRDYTRPENYLYDLKIDNLQIAFFVQRDAGVWTRSELEEKSLTLNRQLALQFISNIESTANDTSTPTEVSKITTLKMADVFKAQIENVQQFDALLSGVVLSTDDMIIKNAGQICPAS